MDSIDFILEILILLFIVSVFGYLISILKEKYDLNNNKIVLKSKTITQSFIDEIELKIFKLGNIKLTIGDQIKILLKNNNSIKGIVLGAQKTDNSILILTLEDKIIELEISNIRKLKILSRYGKII